MINMVTVPEVPVLLMTSCRSKNGNNKKKRFCLYDWQSEFLAHRVYCMFTDIVIYSWLISAFTTGTGYKNQEVKKTKRTLLQTHDCGGSKESDGVNVFVSRHTETALMEF